MIKRVAVCNTLSKLIMVVACMIATFCRGASMFQWTVTDVMDESGDIPEYGSFVGYFVPTYSSNGYISTIDRLPFVDRLSRGSFDEVCQFFDPDSMTFNEDDMFQSSPINNATYAPSGATIQGFAVIFNANNFRDATAFLVTDELSIAVKPHGTSLMDFGSLYYAMWNRIIPVGFDDDREWSYYSNGDGTITIVHVEPEPTGVLNIPSTIDGMTVTGIASAFFGCSELTSVTIPAGVTSIGDCVFEGCSGLTSVTIPDSVTYIGDRAFAGCSGLMSVTIPDGVTGLWHRTFEDCTSLTNIAIPDSVTYIGDSAFLNCSSLTNITIPNGVTRIGLSAFSNTPFFNSLPDGLVVLGKVAYKMKGACPADVTVPDGVVSITASAFYDCSGMTNVTMPSGLTSIGGMAFSKCVGLKSVTIPDSVDSIGSSAFSGCGKLSLALVPIRLSGSVSQASQFADCSSKLQIVFYDGNVEDLVVRVVNFDANGGKTATQSIKVQNGHVVGDMPRAVRPDYRFLGWFTAAEGGDQITEETVVADDITIYAHWMPGEFDFAGDADWIMQEDGSWKSGTISHSQKTSIMKTMSEKGTLSFQWKVSSESAQDKLTFYVDGTQKASISGTNGGWLDNGYRLDAGGLHTFTWTYEKNASVNSGLDCGWIRNIVWTPDGEPIYEIVNGVLKSVYFNGASVVTVPDGVTSIGAVVFAGASKLVGVTIPNSVTNIGNEAFAWCENLTNIVIPNSVKHIGDLAFEGCERLSNVTIGSGVTTIGEEAFAMCPKITSVTIPNGVVSIGTAAFLDCDLTSVTIPRSVRSIGEAAFVGCSRLMSIAVDSGNANYSSANGLLLTKDGKTLVAVPNGVMSVAIPNDVMSIGDYAFEGCDELTSVTIPASVASIGNEAFFECRNLESILFEGNAPAVAPGNLGSVHCVVYVRPGSTGWGVEIPGRWKGWEIQYYGTPIEPPIEPPVEPFTVTFDPGEYGYIGYYPYGDFDGYRLVQYIDYEAVPTAPEIYTYTDEYEFIGWDGDLTAPITSDVTFTAQYQYRDWPPEQDFYIVSFTAGEYGEFSNPYPYTYETGYREAHYDWGCGGYLVADVPEIIAYDGARFIGWRDLSSGDFYPVGSDIYVTWDASFEAEYDGWMYYENFDATLVVRGFTPEPEGELIIPKTFGGKCVTSIEDFAFSCNVGMTSVTIPDSVVSIGAYAFSYCTGLTNIIFEGNAPRIGSDCFKEMSGSCRVHVSKASSGWNVEIPGTWNGLQIEYLQGSIPSIEQGASTSAVVAAVESIGFADAGVKEAIGGSADEYRNFRTWAGTVKGASGTAVAGEAAVVANTNAAAAYLLGAEKLFENAPKVEFGEIAVGEEEPQGTGGSEGTGTSISVCVTVKDGEDVVKCVAEKVQALFEATSSLGDWDGEGAKLTPTVEILEGEGDTMRFKVTPGDGTASRAFLRIRK